MINNFKITVFFGVMIGGLGVSVPVTGVSTPVAFDTVWQSVQQHAPELSAAQNAQAAAAFSRKALAHYKDVSWQLSHRSYISNSPLLRFSEYLAQREVQNSDFDPDYLNSPDTRWFHSLQLGARWLAYDTGSFGYQVKAAQQMETVKTWYLENTRVRLYQRSGSAYARLLQLTRWEKALRDVQTQLDAPFKTYQFRSEKTNPVAYSGWLAYQLLTDRLTATLTTLKSEQTIVRHALTQWAPSLPENWTPLSMTPVMFLNDYFPIPQYLKDSIRTQQQQAQVDSVIWSEKAVEKQWDPQLHLFATQSINSGARSTDGETMAGAVIQWPIASGAQDATVQKVRREKEALRDQLAASKQTDTLQFTQWTQQWTTQDQLIPLSESAIDKLNDQVQVLFKLFKTGNITAAQWVDSVSRLVDALDAYNTLIQNRIDTQTALYYFNQGETR